MQIHNWQHSIYKWIITEYLLTPQRIELMKGIESTVIVGKWSVEWDRLTLIRWSRRMNLNAAVNVLLPRQVLFQRYPAVKLATTYSSFVQQNIRPQFKSFASSRDHDLIIIEKKQHNCYIETMNQFFSPRVFFKFRALIQSIYKPIPITVFYGLPY